jgi:hypothetical protein
VRIALFLALAACAHERYVVSPPEEVDDPAAHLAFRAADLDGYQAAFRLTWNGERIGDARERFVREGEGWRFERNERVQVLRGGALASGRTRVTILVDNLLVARQIDVERETGPARASGRAVRLRDHSWEIADGGAAPHIVDGAAVPATLVPILVAARGGRGYDGPILVEGAGLASARMVVQVSGRVAHARFITAAGEIRTEARLDERGFVSGAGGTVGVASERVPPEALDAPFAPPEIVASSAVPVDGRQSPGRELRLTITGVDADPPQRLDFQQVAASGGTWRVVVAEQAVAPPADVRERTHHVARTLGDDLGVAVLSSEEALAAGRGDCTAHAVVLARLLEERGYQARLVTGFVLEDGALRRHRWVTVRVGKTWIPLDPMLDEAPASTRHLALAVHGAGLDELAFVDDVAFAGWDAARARFSP